MYVKRCVIVMMMFFLSLGIFVEISTGNHLKREEEMITQNYKASYSSEEIQECDLTQFGAGDIEENVEIVETTSSEIEIAKAEAEAKAKAEAEAFKAAVLNARTYAISLSELQYSATNSVKESDSWAISFEEELDDGTRIYSFKGAKYTVPTNLKKREPMISSNGYVERITHVPHYVQQSYPYTKYGGYGTVSSHGCGITSCAMVYSYLLDYEIRPDELAEKYGRYNTAKGSSYSLFTSTAKDFNLSVKTSYSWTEVVESLKKGSVVIANVKSNSIFTTGGHYIVLYGITDEGKILINDSNLYNYRNGKSDALKEGFKNGFEQKYCNFASAYFIYNPKDIDTIASANCAKN